MSVHDCLVAGIFSPKKITKKTGRPLAEVTAELLALHASLTGQFPKIMLAMKPMNLRRGISRADALNSLFDGMTERQQAVLDHALNGLFASKDVAAQMCISDLMVRTARSAMMKRARVSSFEEVVRLVLFPVAKRAKRK